MRVLLDLVEWFFGVKIFYLFFGNFNIVVIIMKSYRMFIKDMGYILLVEFLNINLVLFRNKIYCFDVFRLFRLVIKMIEFFVSYLEFFVGEEGGFFLFIVVSCCCLFNVVCKWFFFVDDLLISR